VPKDTPAARFRAIADDCAKLFERKNTEYGNSIEATGVLGASIEIIGAAARLPKLVLKNPLRIPYVHTILRDIFMDIANYAIIALMMIDKQNWTGRNPWED
jgi:hypothetical protein